MDVNELAGLKAAENKADLTDGLKNSATGIP
jgi:hypothetical protein